MPNAYRAKVAKNKAHETMEGATSCKGLVRTQGTTEQGYRYVDKGTADFSKQSLSTQSSSTVI